VKKKSQEKLKVWWIPQVPGQRFEVPVKTIDEAVLLLTALADYDKFQYEQNVKPDYSNAGGLLVFEEKDQEWLDWENEEGESIDDVMDERISLAAR
jgi:hypothetical protein